MDKNGAVTPAIADRWIVTDDGKSYIFRLRDGDWPDGSAITAKTVRAGLQRTLRGLSGSALGLDAAQISDVRAMAERVVEIRLSSPMPDFLQLLAQPELAIRRKGAAFGPMSMSRKGSIATLELRSPDEMGLPIDDEWGEHNRPVEVQSLQAEEAISRFKSGTADIVLNGRLGALPLIDMGPLSGSVLQLDPALGLFGLQVKHDKGFLAEAEGREALSMALDRDSLGNAVNIGGWTPTSRIVAAGLEGDLGTIGERWTDVPIAQRREEAALRVAAWKASIRSELSGKTKRAGPAASEPLLFRLTVWLPKGPGFDRLLVELTRQYAEIGVKLERADNYKSADLALVDEVARYAGARWFLNQFNCKLKRGVCSPEADKRVSEAIVATDPVERAALLTEAEAELTSSNAYIPFGAPIRWSLVRGSQTGFATNRWAFHPLPELAALPK
ncbi:peptide ABC transporter substrate-binding protein [Altererythrobacter indicus]|uniref:Peptide ABC transporter substrate-binding protein n=1 Tax=Altericroceibacterium indicum TaxID=374177 RepID=A0A845ACD1_9SPHN|nr:ABC transporter substrate-binding protein [Altericroceibacterium indicum]MXP26903.1 peptide ABC transporter substrate-binding protein [Altericroceibacterium indicum]